MLSLRSAVAFTSSIKSCAAKRSSSARVSASTMCGLRPRWNTSALLVNWRGRGMTCTSLLGASFCSVFACACALIAPIEMSAQLKRAHWLNLRVRVLSILGLLSRGANLWCCSFHVRGRYVVLSAAFLLEMGGGGQIIIFAQGLKRH